jgi:CxxH/CxxC protein (TIGR04129 family)
MKIYCCEEHVEMALEIVINESGTAPLLQPIESKELLTKTCEYCGQLAIYIVANEYSHTKCGQ